MKNPYIIGTSGWNYKDWQGVFYPADLPQKKWLQFYEKFFNVVEINSTFYRFFPKHVFEVWQAQAKYNFHYIIKVNRLITHRKYLINTDDLIKKFCQSIAILENKLALILLQLPPNMPYDLDRLRHALLSFPNPRKVVVEFRNKAWLTDDTKKLLTELKCIYCIADSPIMNLHQQNWLTAPTAYIRLHGKKEWFNYNYTHAELNDIAKFARDLTKQGAKKVYILFNNDYYANAINNALYLYDLLNEK